MSIVYSGGGIYWWADFDKQLFWRSGLTGTLTLGWGGCGGGNLMGPLKTDYLAQPPVDGWTALGHSFSPQFIPSSWVGRLFWGGIILWGVN